MRSWRSIISLPNFIALTAFCGHAALFLIDISPYWFSPDWVTDDAMQQVYHFHEVNNPGIFDNDIVTESMRGYLAPLHYWLCYLITYFTGDPIIMAHWVMLIQLFLTTFFLFLTVNSWVGVFPAFFAATWFLHSESLIQRLTGGLPRGWISPLIAMYLYAASRKSHFAVLAILLAACLLNSLAAFLLIVTHGLYLSYRIFLKRTRKEYLKGAALFLFACPIYLGVTTQVIKRPPHIGKMASYEEALNEPALSKSGRFKIAPLPPALLEFRTQAFQIFSVEYQKVLRPLKAYIPIFVTSLIGLLIILAMLRKTSPSPPIIFALLCSTALCYFAARVLAFQLYVPNRFIRFPFSLFCLTFFPIAAWKIFHRTPENPLSTKVADAKYSYLALAALAVFIYLGTGSGLQKEAGYNYYRGQDGHIFDWLKNNSATDSTIAGYPNFVDPVPLFAMRKVYISNETAHPFYDKYYEVVKRRLNVTLRAHYAENIEEFLKVLGDEKIDYFIFEKARFYPDALKKASYFAPFDLLVEEITRRPFGEYLYFRFPDQVDLERHPYMPFRDDNAVLIDIKELRKWALNN